MDRRRSTANNASAGTSHSKPLSREALRKANHSMIERRRREKINQAFSELREMVPGLSGGGEGLKGEFKLEVLERTVEHMRLLMSRLDVLETASNSRSQPVHPTQGMSTHLNADPSHQPITNQSKKRKRPNPASAVSSRASQSRLRAIDSVSSDEPERDERTKPEEAEENDDEEDCDGTHDETKDTREMAGRALSPAGASGSGRSSDVDAEGSSDEEPLRLSRPPGGTSRQPHNATHMDEVAQSHVHSRVPLSPRRTLPAPTPMSLMKPTGTHRTAEEYQAYPSLPRQHLHLPALHAHSRLHLPIRLQSTPPLPLSNLLNPTSPRLRTNSSLFPSSPTPSRTDSEATVLESGLPSPGSSSGLTNLGIVDGIAVRVDLMHHNASSIGMSTVGDQPTPISSLSLAHRSSYHPYTFQPTSTSGSMPPSSTPLAYQQSKKDLFLTNLTEMSPVSPFIIASSSSGSSTTQRGSGGEGMMSNMMPEPSPLLPPTMQRSSIAGLFELDPIPIEAERESSGGSMDTESAQRNRNMDQIRSGWSSELKQAEHVDDEEEAANILLALSSPESMAPTPWHSASKGASPPSGFSLDLGDQSLATTTTHDMDSLSVSRSSTSARGGRLAKSARDFLNMREDSFGRAALTQVG